LLAKFVHDEKPLPVVFLADTTRSEDRLLVPSFSSPAPRALPPGAFTARATRPFNSYPHDPPQSGNAPVLLTHMVADDPPEGCVRERRSVQDDDFRGQLLGAEADAARALVRTHVVQARFPNPAKVFVVADEAQQHARIRGWSRQERNSLNPRPGRRFGKDLPLPVALPFMLGSLVRHVIEHRRKKLSNAVYAQSLAVAAGPQRKRAESGKNFVVAIQDLVFVAGVNHVGARRAPDGIPVGVHLQEVFRNRPGGARRVALRLPFAGVVGIRFAGSLQVAAVFSEKLPNRINAVLRVKVQPHFVFVPVVPGDPDAQRAVRLQTASPRAVLPTWPERPVVPEL